MLKLSFDKILRASIKYFPLYVFLANSSASYSNFLENKLKIKEIISENGVNKIEKQIRPIWKLCISIPNDSEKIGIDINKERI